MSKMEKLELRNGDSINVYFCNDDLPRIITTYGLPDGKEYIISCLRTDEKYGDTDLLEIHTYGDPEDERITNITKMSRKKMRENAYG